MKWLASLLLIGVFVRHDTASWLAAHSSFTVYAWFYMLGGIWEAVLCGILLFFVLGGKGPWRYLAASAMVIGMLEGMQIAICRLSVVKVSSVPAGMNLCDYVTGLPVGATMTALYIIVLFLGIGKAYHEA